MRRRASAEGGRSSGPATWTWGPSGAGRALAALVQAEERAEEEPAEEREGGRA